MECMCECAVVGYRIESGIFVATILVAVLLNSLVDGDACDACDDKNVCNEKMMVMLTKTIR